MPTTTTFRALGVKPWLVSAMKTLGINSPTPVQAACIPAILREENVVASAETGTGKTAAFVVPMLQTLADDPYGVCGLIITPTRELAFQISQQVSAMGARIAVRQYVLVGGIDEITQASALQARPHIVIATPGRLAMMIKREAIDLSRVRYLILDEADRLLDPTYVDDLSTALDACTSDNRQTLMFSATMTPSLDLLQQSIQDVKPPFRFNARDNRFATVEALDQRYIFLPVNLKECHLVYLLKQRYPTESVIIFVSKCYTAELLLRLLNLLGMKKVVAMHSDMKQTERIQALQKFKSGSVRALIATDVASRGLDIPACQLVINYDLPQATATYVHRVGRTARAGRSGLAVTLVTQSDIKLLHAVEKRIERKIELLEDVDEEEVLSHLSGALKAKQMASLNLQENGFENRNQTKRATSRALGKKRRRQQSSATANKGTETGTTNANKRPKETVPPE